MSEWMMHRWHGTPAAVAAALRGLGWHGPGDPPAVPDPRIGGFIPPPGEAAREFDGCAYVAIVATEAIPLPAGLLPTGPQLSTALLGSF
ncbi:hypothetical protein [Falsiroseomonas sp. CW058]|uniref:hypothetical protein n=1 Tax=Falsiroseomonas sp. CW058 TaxID=3388664 RepID=UPI003D31BBF9